MQTARRYRSRPRRAAEKKMMIPAREMRRAEGGGRSGADRRDLGTAVGCNNCSQFDCRNVRSEWEEQREGTKGRR